jgi:hypothetical protein
MFGPCKQVAIGTPDATHQATTPVVRTSVERDVAMHTIDPPMVGTERGERGKEKHQRTLDAAINPLGQLVSNDEDPDEEVELEP